MIVKKYFFGIINFSFCVFIGVICFTYFTKTGGYAELLSHFAFLFFLISLIYFVFYIFYGHKLLMIFAFMGCAVTAYPWMCLLTGAKGAKHSGPGDDVSILQCNIWYKIKSVEDFLAYVKEKNFPDIIVIQEVTSELVHKLKPLKNNYPYVFEAPEDSAYGMILLSKIPITNAQRVRFSDGYNQYTIVYFKSPKSNIPFALVELHASSPLGDRAMNQRRQQLEEISKIISDLPSEHKILVGDLNTTPYSPYFSKLLKVSGLVNSMQGARIQGTWPSHIPSYLRIPLDHLLVSEKIHVVKQEVCPPLGSDHLPVLTYLRMVQ